ncbi:ABC transporter ATP-binding protein [Bacteroidia bacterium]|nr:ABC transporter ATP-binding protein [Bacteroidia bacterium]
MSDIAIKFEHISKQYRLGLVSTRTLSHDLNRWWQTTVLRKEDPYLRIGEANDRAIRGVSEYVWALRDIDFEVKKGEVLGIIGKNGAGKSTLLKILSRVTSPTTGVIKAKGRIASLLEVGTGFHPELTGRENIYMNGSIMGMTRKEITSKLDEIVEFAGVARYLDTPVKRYSSGMTVRLGFSVAAHLEPDILVVDEVLAVGDAEFQKKAIGKMQEVAQGEGRTVLFVSHNMGAVKNLCKTGLVLKDGQIVYTGLADQAIDYYLENSNNTTGSSVYENPKPKATDINAIYVLDKSENERSVFHFDENVSLKININIEKDYLDTLVMGVRVKDQFERSIFVSNIQFNKYIQEAGNYNLLFTIPKAILMPNQYSVSVSLHIPNQAFISRLNSPVRYTIEETGSNFFQYNGVDNGCVSINGNWQII